MGTPGSDTVINLKQLKVACKDCRLGEICLPRGLDKTEMEKLDSIVDRGRPLSRGEVLYHQGDKLNSLYAVHSGSLRSYTVTQDGTEQTLGFYLPGELVGAGRWTAWKTVATVVLQKHLKPPPSVRCPLIICRVSARNCQACNFR